MNAKQVATEDLQEQGSDYYTYVQKVSSTQDIQDGLCKLRMKHGDATHVSCADRLENALGPFNQAGHDDGEYGAGRTILEVLKKQSLKNICVYIIRYFGGIKLGKRRFKILQSLTERAVNLYGHKARERRSKLFRTTSQESVISHILHCHMTSVPTMTNRQKKQPQKSQKTMANLVLLYKQMPLRNKVVPFD